MNRSAASYIAQVAILAALYYGAARLGLSLAFVAEQASAIWPPSGIALAAVLLLGYRVWPGIALGAFLANAGAGEPYATALAVAMGNTAEAIAGAWLLERVVGIDRALSRLRDVVGLLTLSALASTTISATVGVASLCLSGVHPWSRFGEIWGVWWLGDAVGIAVVAPLLLTWSSPRRALPQGRQLAEASLLLASLAAVLGLIYSGAFSEAAGHYAFEYLVFPYVVWAAVRLGHAGATLVTALVASSAIAAAVIGLSPFSGDSLHEQLIGLQLFVGMLSLTGLLLSAAINERRRAGARLRAAYRVSQILAESETPLESAPHIVRAVCQTLHWDIGAVWRVDSSAGVLRCVDVADAASADTAGSVPLRQPLRRFPEFEAVTRERTFERGIGLPGRVWATGQPAWIRDVVHDTNFPRAPIAGREGLHGAFGFPILLGAEVLGVIEFFSSEIRQPDEELLQMMGTIGHQMGQFIERKQGEADLRTAREQLQSVTDTMAAAVTRCSRDLRYVWVSRGYAQWLGSTPEAIMGRPIVEILGPAGYEVIRPYVERVLCGERVEYEAELPYPNVGKRWISAVYVPTFDAAGAPDGWVAVVVDMTHRKELEEGIAALNQDLSRRLEELCASESLKTAMLETALDCIITIDRQGRIVEFNRQAEQIFGYQRADVLGREMCELIIPHRLRESHRQGMVRFLTTGVGPVLGKRIEMPALRVDGTEFPAELAISQINSGGDTLFTAYLRDITERKRAEESLKEADRRKDEFLATLAHELRNPLAPISNSTQILQARLPDIPELQMAAGVIERQVRQLTRLVDDLLDVSRITRGKIQLQPERVLLAEVVQRAVEISLPLVNTCGQRLVIDLPHEPIWLEADPTRLAQVLANLLNNAAKYSEAGSQIDLSARVNRVPEGTPHAPREVREPWVDSSSADGARRVPATMAGCPSELVVCVRDRGIGIAREMLAKVFEPFTQDDRSLERAHGGLGLGLTLVKRLVELHHGSVEAHSDGPGKGSEFIVRLPLPEFQPMVAAPAAPVATNGQPAPATQRRVLVVDDNRDSAETMTLLLRKRGHLVCTAYDGLEAVESAAAFQPQLVLLDIGLPKLNGYEAAQRIREQPGGKSIRLVALTGWGQDEDRRRSREAGFDDHLVKPIDRNVLEALLASVP